MPAVEILTVGHSNHGADAFLELLRGTGVELVVDVRANPRSRYPQFNHNDLAAELRETGIDYAHLGQRLGGRRESLPASRNTALPEGAFRGYADHMATEDFAQGLTELKQLGEECRSAIMCAEADWRHCHRRLVADALLADGIRVLHLGADGSLERHELSESAVLDRGGLTYPARQTSLGL